MGLPDLWPGVKDPETSHLYLNSCSPYREVAEETPGRKEFHEAILNYDYCWTSEYLQQFLARCCTKIGTGKPYLFELVERCFCRGYGEMLTAIQLCVILKQEKLLNYLLADPMTDVAVPSFPNSWTVLMFAAAFESSVGIVSFILQRNSSVEFVNIKNSEGYTALDYASPHSSVYSLLHYHGAVHSSDIGVDHPCDGTHGEMNDLQVLKNQRDQDETRRALDAEQKALEIKVKAIGSIQKLSLYKRNDVKNVTDVSRRPAEMTKVPCRFWQPPSKTPYSEESNRKKASPVGIATRAGDTEVTETDFSMNRDACKKNGAVAKDVIRRAAARGSRRKSQSSGISHRNAASQQPTQDEPNDVGGSLGHAIAKISTGAVAIEAVPSKSGIGLRRTLSDDNGTPLKGTKSPTISSQ